MDRTSSHDLQEIFMVPSLPPDAIGRAAGFTGINPTGSHFSAAEHGVNSDGMAEAQPSMYRGFETARHFLRWAKSDDQSQLLMGQALTRTNGLTGTNTVATQRIGSWIHGGCKTALRPQDLLVLAWTLDDLSLALSMTEDNNGLASLARFRAWSIEEAYKQANKDALTDLSLLIRDNRDSRAFEKNVRLVKQVSIDRQETLEYAGQLSKGIKNLRTRPPVFDAWLDDLKTNLSSVIDISNQVLSMAASTGSFGEVDI